MALQTDLNVSPYYDDFDPRKDYYRVLFQPGVAVQARELNQLQSILQHQIEKFGDNIFKRGTIIEGCNITRHASLPYVKVNDLSTDGNQITVSLFDNLYARNSSNVQAYIVKTEAGFESRSPDLNTLFVKYVNSGDDSNTATFSPGDTLTIFDNDYPISKVNVLDGSSLFSNADSVVFMSAIAVQNSTGGTAFSTGFNVGDTIQNGVANAVIVQANTTANTDALVLKVRPLFSDLVTANTIKWRFGQGETIRDANTTQVATITQVIGQGATGSITTDALGKILAVSVTGSGSGYYVEPYTTVKIESTSSVATSAEIEQLDLTAQNFLTNITVANAALASIGVGYGVTVDEGTIYQKGFFSRVGNQLIVVNKYSNTGFTKSVGFYTQEALINSNQDTTLLDNATGTYNYAAPGADRLKLTPVLNVLDKNEADANTDFLPIIEFADGRPYKQNLDTVYNVIGRNIAQRTYEESGNYVIDKFFVATKDASTFTETADVFKIYIDPGKAYINGERVVTFDNYQANVAKGKDVVSNAAAKIKLGLGNYIRVNEFGGVFNFNTGAMVDLYSSAKTYLTSSPAVAITPAGTKIGTARVRSVVYENGSNEPGHPNATYRLYLFDINMDTGKNFADVRSIYYNGTSKAIADVILTNGSAVQQDVRETSLLYKIADATKSANNITYTFRKTDTALTANSTGYIDINLTAGQYFEYTGSLNSSAKRDLIITPLGNYQAQVNATGTVSINGSNVVTGVGTAFTSAFTAGDYVKISNSSGGNSQIAQISQVVNSTSLALVTAVSNTYSGGSIVLYFPQNVPISLNNKESKWANVAVSNSQQMTIYLGNTIANATSGSSTTANVAVTFSAVKNNVSSGAKTSNRSAYARIYIANNTTGSVRGPWALGVSDAYRLRGVWKADGTQRTITVGDPVADVNATADFITITNNPFANGDYVTYSNTAGTGNIGGLSNGTSYYVVYSNSTGFALSATLGGSNVNITTAGSPADDHTFTGNTIFFTENTTGVVDVTNDFYIDTNQTEEYLDTSYLFRKPRRALLSNNDVLLVKFDAFTTTSGNPKTVSSYNVDDTLTLDQLVTGGSINTLEIPEVYTKAGQYYDLRDHIDFRPVSANTINYVTDISSHAAAANAASIINPTEPSEANRFSTAIDFPAPDTTLTANVEYYLGRVDRVVVDSSSNFIVRTGTPGVNPQTPAEPKNSITLQILKIPPYPSLPTAMSANTIAIADTKVLNETLGRRLNDYRVTTVLGGSDISRIQNRGYKMTDIAALEKRIKDLEYYVSFTLAEAIARARFIPSSIDAAVDRYRFGFFVDPFTDYNYSDIQNPEFFATIKGDQLVPFLKEFNIEFQTDSNTQDADLVTLPYNEVTIITQADATDGPIVVTPPPTPVGPQGPTPPPVVANTTGEVTVTTVTQSVTNVTQQQRSLSNNDNGSVYEEFYYTFSSLTGPAELYMVARDNYNAINIYQSRNSTGPWTSVTSSAAASPISSTDIYTKGLSGLNDARGIEHPGELERKSSGPADVGGWIEDQYKILWSHDPVNGQYYKIRVYKGEKHGGLFGGQGKSGTFGYKLFYPTDAVTTTTITVPNPATFQYVGIVNGVTPNEFTITQSFQFINPYYGYYGGFDGSLYMADSQKFTISVTSLKPNTYHKFIFNGEDQTAKCSQARTTTTNTSGLLSDANGVLVFDFYFDAGIDEATTDLARQNQLAAAFAGIKNFKVQSYDGNSTATGSINMKYYTAIAPEAYAVLNTSLTLTDTAVTTSQANTTTEAPVTPVISANTSQAINDAIESTNIKYVDIGGYGYNERGVIDFSSLRINLV